MATKVSIIGAGRVGEMCALALMREEVSSEVVLFDVVDGMPQGKGLDLKHATTIVRSDTKVWGTNDYGFLAGSDVVVVTAGLPRKPGMDRMDLLKKNLDINKEVVNNIIKFAPDTKILYVANPVDVMTYAAWKYSGFTSNRVFGMAGILDTSRFRAFISLEANLSVKDIQAMVLGGHGDSMVPLVSHATVGGIPLTHFLPKDKLDAIVERTRKGGGEIVSLLKSGSAYFAPGNATAEMVKAVLNDERRVLPVVAYLENKYGYSDVYAGAPVVLGKNGVERVLELKLSDEEAQAYETSLSHVKQSIEQAKEIF